VRAARSLLEFVEDSYSVPQDIVGAFISRSLLVRWCLTPHGEKIFCTFFNEKVVNRADGVFSISVDV